MATIFFDELEWIERAVGWLAAGMASVFMLLLAGFILI